MGTNLSLTSTQRAWIACAIDSEGSIFFEKTNKGKYPTVVVYNTDKKYIEFVSWIMKHKIDSWNKHNTGTDKKWKKCYKVKLSGTQCISFLKEIQSYLIIKREKALDAIECNVCTKEEHLKKINSKPHKRDSKGRFI